MYLRFSFSLGFGTQTADVVGIWASVLKVYHIHMC